MYKNCREEMLAVMRAFVIETGENEFSRSEAIAAMRRSGSKYSSGAVSAHLTYEIDEVSAYIELIKQNIEYEHLMAYGEWRDKALYEELLEVICEVVCVKRKTVRVGGEDYPYELVKSKFLKLDSTHLQYVIGCMQNTTTKIANIKAYMITSLYNAPNTINHYYQQEVQHDMYGVDGMKRILCKVIRPALAIGIWVLTCYPVCNKAEGVDFFLFWILVGFPFGIRKMCMVLIPKNFGIAGSMGVLALNAIVGGLIGGVVLIIKVLGMAVEFMKIITGHFWTRCPEV